MIRINHPQMFDGYFPRIGRRFKLKKDEPWTNFAMVEPLPRWDCAPSPLAGEGWGGGASAVNTTRVEKTPTRP
jgi:hypothetical protein